MATASSAETKNTVQSGSRTTLVTNIALIVFIVSYLFATTDFASWNGTPNARKPSTPEPSQQPTVGKAAAQLSVSPSKAPGVTDAASWPQHQQGDPNIKGAPQCNTSKGGSPRVVTRTAAMPITAFELHEPRARRGIEVIGRGRKAAWDIQSHPFGCYEVGSRCVNRCFCVVDDGAICNISDVPECLAHYIREDRRGRAEIKETLLQRARDVAKLWRSPRGPQCATIRDAMVGPLKAKIPMAAFAKDHGPAVTIRNPTYGLWRTDLNAALAKAGVFANATREKLLKAFGTDAFGVVLPLSFSDFPEETGEFSFSVFSANAARSSSFLVHDYFMSKDTRNSREVLKFARNSGYQPYAEAVFGKCVSPESQSTNSTPPDCPSRDTVVPDLVKCERESHSAKWATRQKAAFFHGSPTHKLRKIVGRHLNTPHSVINVAFSYGRKKKTKYVPLESHFSYRGVWAIRGQSASLRDRNLLLTGAAMFRFLHLLDEPLQLYHQLLVPFVHYVPFVHTTPLHLVTKPTTEHTGHWRNLEKVLSELFEDPKYDRLLQQVAKNDLLIAKYLADEQLRLEVYAETIHIFTDIIVDAAIEGSPSVRGRGAPGRDPEEARMSACARDLLFSTEQYARDFVTKLNRGTEDTLAVHHTQPPK